MLVPCAFCAMCRLVPCAVFCHLPFCALRRFKAVYVSGYLCLLLFVQTFGLLCTLLDKYIFTNANLRTTTGTAVKKLI